MFIVQEARRGPILSNYSWLDLNVFHNIPKVHTKIVMKYSDNWNTILGTPPPPPLAVRPLVVDMCRALLRIVSVRSGGRFGHIKNIKPCIASR